MAGGCRPLSGQNWCGQVALGDISAREGGGSVRIPAQRHHHHHLLSCRDSSGLFPSTSNLSSTYTSTPDMLGSTVHHPSKPTLDSHDILGNQDVPIESQTLPRRIHLCTERQEKTDGSKAAAALEMPSTEQCELEGKQYPPSRNTQRQASPTIPSQYHPSYHKRESFTEMVAIPEEEGELSLSLHGRLSSSNVHGSLKKATSASNGSTPSSDEVLGKKEPNTPISHAPSDGGKMKENVLTPLTGDVCPVMHQLMEVPQNMCNTHSLICGDVSSQLHTESRAMGASPVQNVPGGPQSTRASHEGITPIPIIGLHDSPWRRHVALRGPQVALNGQQNAVGRARCGLYVGSKCKQTDV